MVSPTEGEVMAINLEVVNNPALVRSDPYGKGWLVTVNVPDEESTTRNLIPKGLVHEWMRLAVDRLYSHQPMLAGAAAADGGRPAEDLLADLPTFIPGPVPSPLARLSDRGADAGEGTRPTPVGKIDV